MLVHLRELAMAPVALDELALAGDRLDRDVGVLDGPGVALLALAVVGAVVAAERGQPPVAQLPDPRHGRVEERPVVRRDQQRPAALAQVVLEPFDGVEVEVVRGLVEQQQVRVGDDQPGQRGARLLAAGHRRRRLRPLVPREPEAAQRRVDPQVERVPAEDVVLVLEVGVGGLGRRGPSRSNVGERLGHPVEMRGAGPDRRAQVRRGHEDLVEVGLLREQADATARACATTSPRSGSSRPAARRSSVVLPAPFGPTRPIRSPSAIAASMSSRITNVPTSRVTPFEPQDRHQRLRVRGRRSRAPPARRAAARRVAAACLVRSVRSDQRGPVRRTPAGHPAQDRLARPRGRAAGSRWHHEQKCVLRAPMTMRLIGRPQRGHGSPVRW